MSPPAQEPAPQIQGLMARLGLNRPELRAWAMYDWANSAMVVVIITAVFPRFFSLVACADVASEQTRNLRYGTVTYLSIGVAAVLAPILGAIADYAGLKKRLLGVFLSIGTAALAAMYFIRSGDWLLASVLFFLANLGATGSFVFYDALLPHVARSEEEANRLSSAGYALGYIGGGLVLLTTLLMISSLKTPDPTLPARLSFVGVAVWWAVFSIPLFRWVPEPPADRRSGEGNIWFVSFGRLRATFNELRRYRHAFLMLLAFLIYNDGIGTIIRVAVFYGTSMQLKDEHMYLAILLTQFVGFPFAFLFGMLAGKIGAKRAVLLGLSVYVVISLVAFAMRPEPGYRHNTWLFFTLAVLVGTVQGGTQALSRSMFASMIPRHKSGEFFGFFGIMDRFSGLFGSTLVLIVFSHNLRIGVLFLAAFFMIGAVLLHLIDIPEGQRTAREAERASIA